MNIKASFICVLAAVATTASAQDPVYSVNIVGIQKVEVINSFTQVGNPFLKQSMDIQSVVGAQLTGGVNYSNADTIHTWDGARYRSYFLVDYPDAPDFHGKWCYLDENDSPQIATEQIPPGKGFWVEIKQFANVISFVGDVEMAATRSVTMSPGFNLVGYPYSTEVELNSAEMNLTLSAGCFGGLSQGTADELYLWTGDSYKNFFLVDYPDAPEFHNKWVYLDTNDIPHVADFTIKPGAAFWYLRKGPVGAFNWITTRPY